MIILKVTKNGSFLEKTQRVGDQIDFPQPFKI